MIVFNGIFKGSSSFLAINFTIAIGINHAESFFIHAASIEDPLLNMDTDFITDFFPGEGHAAIIVTRASKDTDSTFNMD